MSTEARNWARVLQVGDALAKAVLGWLADYADEGGRTFVSLERVSADAEVSIDTARRKLRYLEGLTVLTRVPRWHSPADNSYSYQRRPGDRQTTDETRLAIALSNAELQQLRDLRSEAEPAETGTDSAAEAAKTEVSEAGEGSSQPGGRVAASEGGRVAGSHPGGSTGARGGVALVPPHNPFTNPSSDLAPQPPEGGSADPSGDSGTQIDPRFRSAMDAYPRPTNHASLAYARWRRLDEEGRTLFERAVKGIVAEHKKNPKIAVPDLERFLRDPLTWEAYAARAPADPAAPIPTRFVAINSDELRAEAVIARILGTRWREPAFDAEHNEVGLTIKGASLPQPALGLAGFANGLGEIDDGGWLTVTPQAQRQQFGAWRQALGSWLGSEIRAQQLRVPCEWPSQLKRPV